MLAGTQRNGNQLLPLQSFVTIETPALLAAAFAVGLTDEVPGRGRDA
jgi:hypothetical protein